ncbi:hypothetical protein, partial [Pseudomonas viridiflava]|uniref:hypothetical protein n=1 Tax=Pseudomonas viridiflava TaxID=33069 RepID=UPI001E5E0817
MSTAQLASVLTICSGDQNPMSSATRAGGMTWFATLLATTQTCGFTFGYALRNVATHLASFRDAKIRNTAFTDRP